MMGLTSHFRAELPLFRLLLDTLPNSAAALFDRDLRILCAGGELLPAIGLVGEVEDCLLSDLFEPDQTHLLTKWLVSALQGDSVDALWPFSDKRLRVRVRMVFDGHDSTSVTMMIVCPAANAGDDDMFSPDLIDTQELVPADVGDSQPHATARTIENIRHEFRNPLATVASSAELLERFGDQMTPEKRREHAERIGAEAHRLTRLLDDILKLFAT